MTPTTTSIMRWWNAKSETFTKLCATQKGETFTHGEVVLTHLVLIVFLIIMGIAGALEGGAQ